MIDFLKQKLKGKKVLILGFGREGRSSFKLISQIMPELEIGIADGNISIANDEIIRGFNKEFLHLGSDYLESIPNYNFIIKSPGVLFSHINIPDYCEISSQTSLFIEFYRNQIIGVTGTKGKSTTSSLVNFLLEKSGRKSVLLGNIGKPAFDSIGEIDDETQIIFELSAHQLEFVKVSPHISILLNVFPEHLDYFKNLQQYVKAKYNIGKFQKKNDIFICSSSLKHKPETEAEVIKFGFENNYDAYFEDDKLHFEKDKDVFSIDIAEISLLGKHNQYNVMAAILAVNSCGLDFLQAFKSINEFKGLAHRLEFVGKFRNILFYNDSISTVPESSMEALKTLKNVETIILGGFDRGLDYSEFAKFLIKSEVKNFVFLGKAGDEILNELNKISNRKSAFFKVKDMKDAFNIIWEKTSDNGICLLSPAAASYDQFKNFEHRGDLFVNLAKKA